MSCKKELRRISKEEQEWLDEMVDLQRELPDEKTQRLLDALRRKSEKGSVEAREAARKLLEQK